MRPLTQTSPRELALLACPFGAQIKKVKRHLPREIKTLLPAGLNKRYRDLTGALERTPPQKGENGLDWLKRAFPAGGTAVRDTIRAWEHGTSYARYTRMTGSRVAEICFEFGEFFKDSLSPQGLAAIGGAINILTRPGLATIRPLYYLIALLTLEERKVIGEALDVLWAGNTPEEEKVTLSLRPPAPASLPAKETVIPVPRRRMTVLSEADGLEGYDSSKEYAWNWNALLSKIHDLEEKHKARLQKCHEKDLTQSDALQDAQQSLLQTREECGKLLATNEELKKSQDALQHYSEGLRLEADAAHEQCALAWSARDRIKGKAARLQGMLKEVLMLIEFE